jgi:mannosyltransferase OCH1-like enzyme
MSCYVSHDRPKPAMMRNGVPKLIMQTWKTETLEPTWHACRESLLRVLPADWSYVYLTDDAMLAFIKFAFPDLLKDFKALKYGVQKADILRYLWLYAYGGIYMDLDYEVQRPFFHVIEAIDSPLMVVHSANIKSVLTNSFIVSKPGAPVLLELARSALKRPMGLWWAITKHLEIMTSTGPLAFDSALRESKMPYAVLPQRLFLPDSPMLRDSKKLNNESFLVAADGGTWNSCDTHALNFVNRYKWILLSLVGLFIVRAVLDAYLRSMCLNQLLKRVRFAAAVPKIRRAIEIAENALS